MKNSWKPMHGDVYFTIQMDSEYICRVQGTTWAGDDADYMRLKLGLIYPTYVECSEHLREDWAMLTGHKVLGKEE